MFWFVKQNKNIIHLSFVMNGLEIFRTANYFQDNKEKY